LLAIRCRVLFSIWLSVLYDTTNAGNDTNKLKLKISKITAVCVTRHLKPATCLRAVQKRPLRGNQLKFTLFAFLIQVIIGALPPLFSAVIRPVAFAIEFDDISMVQEAVKEFTPVFQRAVGSNDDGPFLNMSVQRFPAVLPPCRGQSAHTEVFASLTDPYEWGKRLIMQVQ